MSLGALGKTQIAVNTTTIANGDSIASYLVDSAGALLTSTLIGAKQRLDVVGPSEYVDGTAWAAGNYGQEILAVRKDADGAFSGVADGDMSPLQLDSQGKLKVIADLTSGFDYVYAEDSAAAGGEAGAYVLAVRQDTLATSTSADGDFASLKTNSAGSLYVIDTVGNAIHTTINTSLDNIETEIVALSKSEDAGHSSGDKGIMALAVRNDANATLTSADLDYSPLAVDSAGRLKTITSGAFAEDSAAASGDLGSLVLAVRRDTAGAQTSASGDYSEIQTNAVGELRVVNKVETSSLQQLISVTTTAAALPTTSLTNRKHLLIQNIGSSIVYLGSATVTSSGATQGVNLGKGSFYEMDVGPSVSIYGIVASGTNNVIVWEFS